MTMIENQYVADAVMAYLRSGHQPDESDSALLNMLGIIDLLREKASRDDVDSWVMDGVRGAKVEYAGLCLSLMKKYDTEPAVADGLREMWKTAPPMIQSHLIWRIMDDPALPREWHETIFAFILKNQVAFHAGSLKFLGDANTVVENAKRRYLDPRFPESKKWSYLCRVAGVATDTEEAQAFIAMGLKSEDEFTRQVAQVLLDTFYTRGAAK